MNDLLRIHKLLENKSKGKIPKFLILTSVATILEIFSIGLIVPLVSSLLDVKIILFNHLDLSKFNLNNILLVLFFIYSLKTIYLIKFNRWQFNLIYKINHNLTNRLFEKYINFDYYNYLKKNSSELVRNIINVENFTHNIHQSVILVSEIILIFAFLLLLLFFQPLVTLSVVFVGFILGFFFLKVLNPSLIKYGEDYQIKSKALIQEINQSINNFKDIKIYQKQNFFLKKFSISTNVYSNSIKKNEYFKALPRIIIEFVAIIVILLIIFSMLFLQLENKEIISFVALFAAIGFRLIPSLNKIIAAIQHLKYYLKLTDNLSFDLNYIEENLTNSEGIDFVNYIQLKNLEYYYDKKKYIFKNLNLIIEKNKITGIKGKTGSGKTTLVNIITGLLSPTNGEIFVDKKKVNLNNSNWFKKIGYVPQRIMLNETTIKKNIAYGIEDLDIDDERLKKVISLAQLDEFVNNIGGVNKKISELGKNISGGQIQRLGIARALYNEPEILILDESTSNLDKFTEVNFINSIKTLSKNKTLLIISHDDIPLKICDKIYNIDEMLTDR